MSRSRFYPGPRRWRWPGENWRIDSAPRLAAIDQALAELEYEDHRGDYASRHAAVVMVWDAKLQHHRGRRRSYKVRARQKVEGWARRLARQAVQNSGISDISMWEKLYLRVSQARVKELQDLANKLRELD